ncbi:EamA family transporter [Planosporangium sp. 12N6]|uniref:EamA family transporter n=1 Tax=Planosporangium spinosum TaxID=3402278 RepID=UPI003CF7BB28
MVVASGALFALNGTVAKLVLRAGMDPMQLTTLRATGAFVGLLVLTLALAPRRLRFTRRELPLLVGYGLAGFAFVPLLYFIAISRLPVGIALLFEYTAPLLVALWARFGQRQPVRPRLWVGLGLSIAGLAGVAEIWGDLRLNPVGIAAGLGAAALLAVYYLAGARGAARRDPLSLTCLAFGFAAAVGAVLRPWWHFPGHLLRATSGGVPVWLLCCYVVLLGSIAPYLLVSASLRHLPPTSAGIVGMVEPVFAGAIAWLVLDEALAPAQLAGAALILVGVVLAETARTTDGTTTDGTTTDGTTTGRTTAGRTTAGRTTAGRTTAGAVAPEPAVAEIPPI